MVISIILMRDKYFAVSGSAGKQAGHMEYLGRVLKMRMCYNADWIEFQAV